MPNLNRNKDGRMRAPLTNVAGLVFNTPLAMEESALESLLHAVGPRLVFDATSLNVFLQQAADVRRAFPLAWQDDDGDDDDLIVSDSNSSNQRPYDIQGDGIAIIPVNGTLMDQGSWMSSMCGFSSYSGIQKAYSSAMNDASVRGILLKINSPGGSTHGLFELCNTLSANRGKKPMYAVAKHQACSAAYAIACCADKIFVSITGSVGSIGVFALHCDQSGADDKAGLKYEYVKFGAKKTEGNEHSSLSKSARSDLQAEINRQGGMFVNLVARNRNQTYGKVMDTEAGLYCGDTSVPLLADAVGTFEQALAEMSRRPLDNSATIPTRRAAATSESTLQAQGVQRAQGSQETGMADVAATTTTATAADLNTVAVATAAQAALDKLAADKMDCKTCNGSGMVDGKACSACNGSGKMSATAPPAEPNDDDEDDMPDPKNAVAPGSVVVNGHTYVLNGAPGLAASPAPLPNSSKETTVPTPVLTQADIDAAVTTATAAANAAHTAYVEDLTDLCALAGAEDQLSAFLTAKTPIADVRKQLRDKRAAALASGVDGRVGVPALNGADPLASFNQFVTTAQQQNPSAKRSDVIMSVMRQQPQLYSQFEDHRDTALASPAGKRKYLAELGPRLASMGLSGHRAS